MPTRQFQLERCTRAHIVLVESWSFHLPLNTGATISTVIVRIKFYHPSAAYTIEEWDVISLVTLHSARQWRILRDRSGRVNRLSPQEKNTTD